MAVFNPDNDFFTTTAIGTVSNQLTLTNTGNTDENALILTLPGHFTISNGSTNSCTVAGSNGDLTGTTLTTSGSTSSCNVTVTYNNTTATSQASDNISIAYNYNNGTAAIPAIAAVNYRVTQSTAVLSLSNPWNPYNFINIAGNGTDLATQTFTMYNSGDVDATNVTGSINPDNTVFSIQSHYNSTIPAKSSGSLDLQFGTSAVLGAYATTLTVNYNDYPAHAATPVAVSVTGSVSNAIAYLKDIDAIGFTGGDGETVNTAYALPIENSGQITLTYENKGNEDATNFKLTTGTISGKLIGTPFTLITDGCNLDSGGITLAQGQTCDEILQYSPTATGITTLPLNTINWQYSYSDAHGNYTYNSAPVYFSAYNLTITTTPNNGAVNISPSLNQFKVNFNSYSMNASSVNVNNISLTLDGSSSNILASCSASDNNTYICTTSTGLIPNRTYIFHGSNLLTTDNEFLDFSSSFTTANITKYAYIGSYDGGVTKCVINNITGALGGCNREQTSISQVEAVFIFNGRAYLSSGANAVYLCEINDSTGELSNCNQTGSNFSQPKGIAIRGTMAYVANSSNNSVIKCNLTNDGSLTDCENASVISLSDPQGLVINNNYLLITNNGNSKIVTCTLDSVTGLATSCYTNSNPPDKKYQDIAVANNNIGYIVAREGGSYAATCPYFSSSGTLGACTNFSIPGSDYEGLSIYNNMIYVSSSTGVIGWCPLNPNGTVSNVGCSFTTGISNPRGMSIN